jgi:segregation and condensation protein B
MTDNTSTDVSTETPAETPTETDTPTELDDATDFDSGLGLGIDVANAPELEDSELGAVLEALLLVVDTPVTVEQLAAATEQPADRVGAKLQAMAVELRDRESGIDLREAGGGWRMYTRARFAPYV